MPQSLDAKIVHDLATRLNKDESHIRRLIKSGRLEHRYLRPNEGPPVPHDLRGKIPVPRNYVEVNVGQRTRPSRKSLAGRLDATLGKDGSARQKIWHKLLALFDDRELTANQVEALKVAFEVMAKSADRPEEFSKILEEALHKSHRKMHGPSRKKSRNTVLAKVKKAGRLIHSDWITKKLGRLREQDAIRLRQFARISEEITRNALLARRITRNKKWTQERIAKSLGLSKSGYRKFLQRMGLHSASRLTQLNQTHTGRCGYSGRVD